MTQKVTDAELEPFLASMPEDTALQARTLAHAWQMGGGIVAAGQVAARLRIDAEPPFTAATLKHVGETVELELCRVILSHHGIDDDAWTHWSDELAELAALGIDLQARFPTLQLGASVSAADLARLATALRDLARMATE